MSRYSICVLLACLCSDASSFELVGSWLSDKEMSSLALDAREDIPQESKSYLRNQFGFLLAEYSKDSVHWYFSDEDNIASNRPRRYSVETVEPDKVILSVASGDGGTIEELVLHIEGDCYYVISESKWKHREYFCRVES